MILFLKIACFSLWLFLLSHRQNSLKMVCGTVCHATFSEICMSLHGCFPIINLLYDLMKRFFKERLKTAPESVSLLLHLSTMKNYKEQ